MTRISEVLIIICIALIATCIGIVSHALFELPTGIAGVLGGTSFLALVAFHQLSSRAASKQDLSLKVGDLDRVTQKVLRENASIRERIAGITVDDQHAVAQRTSRVEADVRSIGAVVEELTLAMTGVEKNLGIPSTIAIAARKAANDARTVPARPSRFLSPPGGNSSAGGSSRFGAEERSGNRNAVSASAIGAGSHFLEATELSSATAIPTGATRLNDIRLGHRPESSIDLSTRLAQHQGAANLDLGGPHRADSALKAGWSAAIADFQRNVGHASLSEKRTGTRERDFGSDEKRSSRSHTASADEGSYDGRSAAQRSMQGGELSKRGDSSSTLTHPAGLAPSSRLGGQASAGQDGLSGIASKSIESKSPAGAKTFAAGGGTSPGEIVSENVGRFSKPTDTQSRMPLSVGIATMNAKDTPQVRSAANAPEATAGSSHAIVASGMSTAEPFSQDVYLEPMVRLPMRKVSSYRAELRWTQGRGADRGAGGSSANGEALVSHTLQILRRLRERNQAISIFARVSNSLLLDPLARQLLVDSVTKAEETLVNRLVLEFTQADIGAFGPVEHDVLRTLRAKGVRFALGEVIDLLTDFRLLSSLGFRAVFLDVRRVLSQEPLAGQEILMADQAGLFQRLGMDLVATEVESETSVPELIEYDIFYATGPLFGSPRAVKRSVLKGNGGGADATAEPVRAVG